MLKLSFVPTNLIMFTDYSEAAASISDGLNNGTRYIGVPIQQEMTAFISVLMSHKHAPDNFELIPRLDTFEGLTIDEIDIYLKSLNDVAKAEGKICYFDKNGLDEYVYSMFLRVEPVKPNMLFAPESESVSECFIRKINNSLLFPGNRSWSRFKCRVTLNEFGQITPEQLNSILLQFSEVGWSIKYGFIQSSEYFTSDFIFDGKSEIKEVDITYFEQR